MKRIKPALIILVILFQFAGALAQQGDGTNDINSKREVLKKQFKKELIQIVEGVYVAVGYGASNSVLIEGKDSLIIVDTMLGTEAAENVLAAFRKISSKPVKALFFTHSHTDHVGGASVFAKANNPDIYARSTKSTSLVGYDKLKDVLGKRARRQFGSDLSPEEKIPGIAPVYRPMGGRGAGKLKPNKILKDELNKLKIAGINMEVAAVPGETDDHLYVWLPESEVLICGDNYYFSFPNLYAIRGTQYRDISKWIKSLDKLIKLDAEYLISGHARPIVGRENVRRILTGYREAISYVLNETLKLMNEGKTADEIASLVKLPAELSGRDDLREFYGVVEWSVRSVYNGYLGWFDGNPTNLFPLAPAEEAEKMIKLAGSKGAVVKQIREALDSKEFQWACRLADYLLALEPGSKEINLFKAEALFALADRQMSSNARHYYLSVAKELKKKYK